MSNISLSYLVQENLKSYKPNLSELELQKAAQELNEFTSESRNHAINQLARQIEHTLPKQLIDSNINLLSNPVWLLRFLRSGKFRMEKSLKRLIKFLKLYNINESPWPEMTKELLKGDIPNSKLYNFMRIYQPIYTLENVGKNSNYGVITLICDPSENEY